MSFFNSKKEKKTSIKKQAEIKTIQRAFINEGDTLRICGRELPSKLVDIGNFCIDKKRTTIAEIARNCEVSEEEVDDILFYLAGLGVIRYDAINKKALCTFNDPSFYKMIEKMKKDGYTNPYNLCLLDTYYNVSPLESFLCFKKSMVIYSFERNELIDELYQHVLMTLHPSSLMLTSIDLSPYKYLKKYDNNPNIIYDTITKPDKAIGMLRWAVEESMNRLKIFAKYNTNDYTHYAEKASYNIEIPKMPRILLVFNEIYDIANQKDFAETLIKLNTYGPKAGVRVLILTSFDKNAFSGSASKVLSMLDEISIVELENGLNNDNYGEPIFEEPIYDEPSDDSLQSLLDDIDNKIDGKGFETVSKALLEGNGFNDVTVTKASSDYGADVVAVKDDIKYAIQCKCYSGTVGVSAVQEVIASKSIYDCHVGVVLTNSSFSNEAKKLAQANNILLWDRNKLIELILSFEDNKQ